MLRRLVTPALRGRAGQRPMNASSLVMAKKRDEGRPAAAPSALGESEIVEIAHAMRFFRRHHPRRGGSGEHFGY